MAFHRKNVVFCDRCFGCGSLLGDVSGEIWMFGLFHMVYHANGLGFIALTLPLTRPACKRISKTPCHHLWLHLICGRDRSGLSCRCAGNLGWIGRVRAIVSGCCWCRLAVSIGGGASPCGRRATTLWRWRKEPMTDGKALEVASVTDTSGPEWKTAKTGDDTFQGRVGFAWYRADLPDRSALGACCASSRWMCSMPGAASFR